MSVWVNKIQKWFAEGRKGPESSRAHGEETSVRCNDCKAPPNKDDMIYFFSLNAGISRMQYKEEEEGGTAPRVEWRIWSSSALLPSNLDISLRFVTSIYRALDVYPCTNRV